MVHQGRKPDEHGTKSSRMVISWSACKLFAAVHMIGGSQIQPMPRYLARESDSGESYPRDKAQIDGMELVAGYTPDGRFQKVPRGQNWRRLLSTGV